MAKRTRLEDGSLQGESGARLRMDFTVTSEVMVCVAQRFPMAGAEKTAEADTSGSQRVNDHACCKVSRTHQG